MKLVREDQLLAALRNTTDWYPCGINPVRPGWYEIKLPESTDTLMDWWDGQQWCPSPEMGPYKLPLPAVEWRGLRAETRLPLMLEILEVGEVISPEDIFSEKVLAAVQVQLFFLANQISRLEVRPEDDWKKAVDSYFQRVLA